MHTTTITTDASEQHAAPPAFTPGDLYELPARTGLTNAIGDMVTIEDSHQVGPDTYITVSGLVRLAETDVAPGEKRVRHHAWVVAASRLGKLRIADRTPKQIDAWNGICRILAEADDPETTAVQALAAIDREFPETCPVYAWCEETGRHVDHDSPEHLVRHIDDIAEPFVWAAIVHSADSVPCVDLNGTRLCPEQARQKAREFRRLADAVDDMADTAEAARTEMSAAAVLNGQLVIEQAELSDGVPCMWRDQGDRVRVAFDPRQMSEAEARAAVIARVGAARAESTAKA